MTKRITSLMLALTLMLSTLACNKAKVATDPTQPPGFSLAQKFTDAAARADRVAGYAQIAHDRALPVFAGIVKMTPERMARDAAVLLRVRDLSHQLAGVLRTVSDATLKEGKARAGALLDQIAETLKDLEADGFFVFGETSAGQRLEQVVRTAISLLPVAINLLRGDLR